MKKPVFDNEMNLSFSAKSENEALARVCVAAFASRLNPTLADINDIKTAVSEAVTNAIIHGYDGDSSEIKNGTVYIYCALNSGELVIEIMDDGIGIPDIEQAKEPLFTSKPEMERSGMGFTIMETFMDRISIESEIGKGTKIVMYKKLNVQFDKAE